MNSLLSKLVVTPVLAVSILVMCSSALAQGTANGPVTNHTIDQGLVNPVIIIGDPLNPMPIDLDPNGLPWTKKVTDPNFLLANGGIINLFETIKNVGTEPWFDWHEHILPNSMGIAPGTWTTVSITVGGNAIGFNSLGLGTSNLWLDQFTQPVLPGDIMEIRKLISVPTSPFTIGFSMTIDEYPTPEPASAALMGIGSMLVLARRKAAIT